MIAAWTSRVAYCGLPPLPEQIWARWNLDPVLACALVGVLALYALGARRAADGASPLAGRRQAETFFYAGWLIAALALVSPLCALSVSLFSARVGQHMALTLIAAPLIALGQPGRVITPWARRGKVASLGAREPAPLAAAGVFGALLWFWHAPAPYAATFSSPVVYWLMHLSLVGAAVWLWSGLLDVSRARAIRILAAGLISVLQMGLLGAVITLASAPVYTPHLLTSVLWGMTPLQDQQLGGAIMWAPGCAAFLAAALWCMARLLREPMGRMASPPVSA